MQLTYDHTSWKADHLAPERPEDVSALVLTIEVLISVTFWSVVAWRLWPVLS
jgi:hypothetical protein